MDEPHSLQELSVDARTGGSLFAASLRIEQYSIVRLSAHAITSHLNSL